MRLLLSPKQNERKIVHTIIKKYIVQTNTVTCVVLVILLFSRNVGVICVSSAPIVFLCVFTVYCTVMIKSDCIDEVLIVVLYFEDVLYY